LVRDYEQLKSALPVFCVSSRGFQQLSGRFIGDERVSGFLSEEDTELPQLQEHAIEIAARAQAEHSRMFLSDSQVLMISMRLWVTQDRWEIDMTLPDDAKAIELQALEAELKELSEVMPECPCLVKLISGLPYLAPFFL
jgi:hypothetical protein